MKFSKPHRTAEQERRVQGHANTAKKQSKIYKEFNIVDAMREKGIPAEQFDNIDDNEDLDDVDEIRLRETLNSYTAKLLQNKKEAYRLSEALVNGEPELLNYFMDNYKKIYNEIKSNYNDKTSSNAFNIISQMQNDSLNRGYYSKVSGTLITEQIDRIVKKLDEKYNQDLKHKLEALNLALEQADTEMAKTIVKDLGGDKAFKKELNDIEEQVDANAKVFVELDDTALKRLTPDMMRQYFSEYEDDRAQKMTLLYQSDPNNKTVLKDVANFLGFKSYTPLLKMTNAQIIAAINTNTQKTHRVEENALKYEKINNAVALKERLQNMEQNILNAKKNYEDNKNDPRYAQDRIQLRNDLVKLYPYENEKQNKSNDDKMVKMDISKRFKKIIKVINEK